MYHKNHMSVPLNWCSSVSSSYLNSQIDCIWYWLPHLAPLTILLPHSLTPPRFLWISWWARDSKTASLIGRQRNKIAIQSQGNGWQHSIHSSSTNSILACSSDEVTKLRTTVVMAHFTLGGQELLVGRKMTLKGSVVKLRCWKREEKTC